MYNIRQKLIGCLLGVLLSVGLSEKLTDKILKAYTSSIWLISVIKLE